jgi:hypothetical protein
MENGWNGSRRGRRWLPEKQGKLEGLEALMRRWLRLRRPNDSVNFLAVAALKEWKQQAWEATGTLSVIERGGGGEHTGRR